jgi:hypothetical protein
VHFDAPAGTEDQAGLADPAAVDMDTADIDDLSDQSAGEIRALFGEIVIEPAALMDRSGAQS